MNQILSRYARAVRRFFTLWRIVTNPPYGKRVGDRKRLRDLYAQVGNVLRAKCPGWELAMLTAHPELDHQTRLALETRLSTENGGLRVRLMCGRVP